MQTDKPYTPGSLEDLLHTADPAVLRDLLTQLVDTYPEIQRDCLEFLMNAIPLTPEAKVNARVDVMQALWMEVEPDLEELDRYGGGPEGTETRVSNLLYELAERVQSEGLPREDRRALLDEVFPYIRTGNAGMDDPLYEVAYAACYDDEDLRDLARRFETMKRDWPVSHARSIYRRLGDRERYLALRLHTMVYGGDYHDLATLYWEAGEHEQALQVAKEGLQKATGRMDELRAFVAERALEAGNRQEYLELQFAQATDRLTVEAYKSFKALCAAEEWTAYEPRMLAVLERSDARERIEIHILRGEHEQAVTILAKERYPLWADDGLIRAAARLEQRYPEQILAFYRSGLGTLDSAGSRGEYSRKARVALKLRHMWVEVLKTPERWLEFARKVKALNQRRPAFQEEWARVIPDWQSL